MRHERIGLGFVHMQPGTDVAIEEGIARARAMVASARRVMPWIRIVQLTDPTTAPIRGVDEVRRKPREPMGLLRLRHCAGLPGAWIFVDTDVLFQREVGHVFRSAFDVAVTTRDWSHLKAAGGFTERMPYNTGIVFSRCPGFWAEAYTRLRDCDPDLQHFMGEQEVINAVAAETDRYRVKKLRGVYYNFPPEIPGALPSGAELQAAAAILHYKGEPRKRLMLEAITKHRCSP